MFQKYWIFKYLIVASVPLIIYFLLKNIKIFKRIPSLLSLFIAIPSILIALLFYYFI